MYKITAILQLVIPLKFLVAVAPSRPNCVQNGKISITCNNRETLHGLVTN